MKEKVSGRAPTKARLRKRDTLVFKKGGRKMTENYNRIAIATGTTSGSILEGCVGMRNL
jgi:hypothetical protein